MTCTNPYRIMLYRVTFLIGWFLCIPLYCFSKSSCDDEIVSEVNCILSSPVQFDRALDYNHDGNVTISDLCTIIDKRLWIARAEQKKLSIKFRDNDVSVSNTNNLPVEILTMGRPTEIKVVARNLSDLLIEISGSCNDGNIVVDADTTCILRFMGLSLKSSHSSAICSRSKHPIFVELIDGTLNLIEDGIDNDSEQEEKVNGCFHSEGAIHFFGSGLLSVSANNKHAIYSKKSIEIVGSTVDISKTVSDAIHAGKHVSIYNSELNLCNFGQDGIDSDKYIRIEKSKITASVSADAGKGIKCTDDLNIVETYLQMSADGGVQFKTDGLSYCSLIKVDGNICLNSVKANLTHNGDGGKCISCDGDMTINGGEYVLTTYGDGAEYLTDADEIDYYTPKCISSDGALNIMSGNISCSSYGLGAKGIVVGGVLQIGGDTNAEPVIDVLTKGDCIFDDESEDERNGCPKAIKCSDIIYIHNGKITCSTSHSGGEGIESVKSIKINGGTIICNTFDDGINAKNGITVNGGNIYCNSVNNDGLDSNGFITINGGVVKAISQHRFNECLDAEQHQIHINGGTILGISGSPISIASTSQPYFSQGVDEKWNEDASVPLQLGATYSVVAPKGKVQMEIVSPFFTSKAYFFVSAPYLSDSQEYIMRETSEGVVNDILRFTPIYEIITPF